MIPPVAAPGVDLSALAAVQARMTDIRQRFAPGFAAALAEAAATPDTTTGAAGDAGLPEPVWHTPVSPPSSTAAAAAPAGSWGGRLPEQGQRWAPAITSAAEAAGIDPRLLAAVVWAESGFDAGAGSHAGAIGLAQLMPATAAGLGVDPHDPSDNLLGGARYLRAQLDRFGSAELALAAYNAGPGRVARAGGIPQIAETQAYVPRVLDYYSRLQ